MISNKQFRKYIIQPVLQAQKIWSADAEELLIATMAHESLGCTYLMQEDGLGNEVKNGGMGPYQLEEATYTTVYNKFGGIYSLPLLSPDTMIHDLSFATLIARLNYLRFPEPLPDASDIDGIWEYYKKYWNTELGSATKDAFITNYRRFIGKS